MAAVVLSVLLLAAPSAGAKGGSRFFGLDYTFKEFHDADLGKLDKSGVKTVRWTMFWQRIERSSGQFDWSVADTVIGKLADKGIRVLPVLFGTPPWVADSGNVPPVQSSKARKAWKGFVREAVNRYGPAGTYWLTHPGKRALPIGTWQIWNEPNLKSHFSQRRSPHRYARLLKISNSAIAKADPRAKVMFAGMPGYSRDQNAWVFLRRVYRQRGAAHTFDIAALHPYAINVDQMLGEIRRLRKVMRQNGDRRKPLAITEVGWGSDKAVSDGLTKGMQGQKRILKRSFRALKRKRHNWHINRVLWFNYRDPQGKAAHCRFCSSAGLLKNNLEPKPAWRAFRSFTH
jgi:hypothetical protein